MKRSYVFTVREVYERMRTVQVKKIKEEIKSETTSEGWYIRLGTFSLFAGDSKPNINVGDRVSMVIKKLEGH